MDTKAIIRQLVELYSRKIKRGELQEFTDPNADLATNALALTKRAFAVPRRFFLSPEDGFPTHCFDRQVMSFETFETAVYRGDADALSAYLDVVLTPNAILFAFSDEMFDGWNILVHPRLEELSNHFVAISHSCVPFGQKFTPALRDAIGQCPETVTVFGVDLPRQAWIARMCALAIVALPALDMAPVLELLKPYWTTPEALEYLSRLPAAVLSRGVLELQNLMAIQVYTISRNTPDSPLVLTATVISQLYRANTHVVSRGLINYTEFYNATAIALEQEDIVQDFEISMRNQQAPPDAQLFCFSRFPCLVDTKFKALLMQIEAIVQTRTALRDAAITQLFGRNRAEEPFFTLSVRRDRLVQSTLFEIERKVTQLKKPLRVEFIGEQGVDAGGVRKEFFQILMKELLDPNFGMFAANPETRALWFQPKVRCQVSSTEFRLIGTLMGLAVYNNVILDVPFPNALYRKLLGLPMDFEDLKEVDPGLAAGLAELLRFEETDELTVENVFCREFTFEYEVFGEHREVELCPGGRDKLLTSANRDVYVAMVTDLVLNESIAEQFAAFKAGFVSIADRNLMNTMHPQELELLICGQQTFDFAELQETTKYEGYDPTDSTIVQFWQVVRSLSTDDQRLFLKFATGSDRVPVGGLKDLNFVIGRNGDDEAMLPTSHTCFNHLLLPAYQSLDVLRQKLLLAIQNCQGFGLR